MTAHIPTQYEIETFTGKYVDTFAPNPDTICVEDIAHQLANTCRYGGACSRFYSVAEHAVLVANRMREQGHEPIVQLGALHHDSAEAYLGDIPRPMKGLLGDAYRDLSERMDCAIVEALDCGLVFEDLHDPSVKDVDNWALFLEARHLLPSGGINWSGSSLEAWDMAGTIRDNAATDPSYWRGGLTPALAESFFLSAHKSLIQEVN